jgi:hypothetical protein
VTCHYSKRRRDAPEAEVPAARPKKSTEEAAQLVALGVAFASLQSILCTEDGVDERIALIATVSSVA